MHINMQQKGKTCNKKGNYATKYHTFIAFFAIQGQLSNLTFQLNNHLVPTVRLRHAQSLTGEQFLHGREDMLNINRGDC